MEGGGCILSKTENRTRGHGQQCGDWGERGGSIRGINGDGKK